MELLEHIRRDKREGGASIRGLARRHRVHRRTVRQALRSALPSPSQAGHPSRRRGSVRTERRSREWLVADLSAPRYAAPDGAADLASASSTNAARPSPSRRRAPTPVACAASSSPQGDGDDPPAAPDRARKRRSTSAGSASGSTACSGCRSSSCGSPTRGAPCLLPWRGPGGVPRGVRLRAPRRGAAAGPLRQPQGGRDAGARRT